MNSVGNQNDCTQGICSSSCPQWCLPSPSFMFDDHNKSQSSSNISPLAIAIIGILASAFLLVSYYAIVSKYCGNPTQHPSNEDHHQDHDGHDHNDHDDDDQEPWVMNTDGLGLDEGLIKSITLIKFKKGDGEGLFGSSTCSICLGEFVEDNSLRVLPKCSHAFHVACIDTWLKSHSNCPLCRANILSSFSPPQLVLDIINQPHDGHDDDHQDEDQRGNGEIRSGREMGLRAFSDLGGIGLRESILRIGRSISMDHCRETRVSISELPVKILYIGSRESREL